MEWEEERKNESGHPNGPRETSAVELYRMRDDKTEVKSLVLPKTKKVAMLLASMLNYV
jgi:hypothetical protein